MTSFLLFGSLPQRALALTATKENQGKIEEEKLQLLQNVVPYQEFVRKVKQLEIQSLEIDEKFLTAKFVDKLGNKGLVSPFDDPELIKFLQDHNVKLDLQAFNLFSPQNLENIAAVSIFWLCIIGFFYIGYLYGAIGNPFSYL